MVPTSALRETVILIIFGVVLVPIAAKRAQDAPGYWQTFSKELTSLASCDDPALLRYPALRINDTIAYRPSQPAKQGSKQNETLPILYATDSAPHTETSAPLTIRFQIATARDQADVNPATTTGRSGAAIATAAPRSARLPAEPPAIVRASDASRGSWRLIWMGSAIAAVAVFMSLC